MPRRLCDPVTLDFSREVRVKSSDKAAFEAILIFAAILALAMLPIAARAESTGFHGPPTFEEFDRNGDGFITAEEYQATHEARQAAMEGSGANPHFRRPPPKFSDFDSNGDGKLTRQELSAGYESISQARRAGAPGGGYRSGQAKEVPGFSELDLNGDGCISADEYARHVGNSAAKAPAKAATKAPGNYAAKAPGSTD